jgi:hypothetical protein
LLLDENGWELGRMVGRRGNGVGDWERSVKMEML